MWDLVRRALTRLSFSPARDQRPVWTPEGTSIVFDSERAGESNIYMQASDGTGSPVRLTDNPLAQIVTSITADGTQAVLHENAGEAGQDLRVLQLTPRGLIGALATETPATLGTPSANASQGERRAIAEVKTLIATQFDERGATVSPDDRWIAYESDSSGRFEIYVRPFPNVNDGQWQVSMGASVKAGTTT